MYDPPTSSPHPADSPRPAEIKVSVRTRLTAWTLMISGLASGLTGCSSLTGGRLGADDLSLMPRNRLASGQKSWNEGELGDEHYSGRRSTSIHMKDFAPDRIPSTVKKLAGYGPNKAVAEEALAEAQKKYAEAVAIRKQKPDSPEAVEAFLAPIDSLKIAADRWPDSSIEEDALYLLGECHFFADHYDDANDYFEKLVEIYPSTQFLDRVQDYRFHIARYWLKVAESQSALSSPINLTDERKPLKDIAGEARRVLNRIRLDDPTGKLSDDATFLLGQAYYDTQRYFEAAETFSDLRNNYPGSEHQFNAHLMEFESRLAMYDGEHYDGEALRQAENVLRALVQRFPDQTVELEEQLSKEAANVRNQLAQRDLELANYYIRRGQNASARFYLSTLIQDYPETEVATEATRLVQSIKDEPDHPVQRAQWLVDMFPEPRSTRPLIRSGSLK